MIRNFRDVGKGVNEILGTARLKQGVLYRSGAIDSLQATDDVPKVQTVINLTRGHDPSHPDTVGLQICPRDSMNNYDIASTVFRDWIGRLFEEIVQDCVWPIWIHCHAGKDRTGVAVALLLKNAGIPDQAIIDEYMKSEGTLYPESIGQLLSATRTMEFLRMGDKQRQKLVSLLLS